MNDLTMSERDWRLDPLRETSAGSTPDRDAEHRSRFVSPCQTGSFVRFRNQVLGWARGLSRATAATPRIGREEEIIHHLAQVLSSASDAAVIVAALVESVHQTLPGRSVQWIWTRDSSPCSACSGESLDMVIGRCETKGCLRVCAAPAQPSRLSPAADARLRTLCSMATMALDRLDRQASNGGSVADALHIDESAKATTPHDSLSNPASLVSIGTPSGDSATALKVLQDATFFHAIVPYALAQARRHGEQLALLCLSVDRLNGIHELLGRGKADEAVQRTGFQVATMIRESDLVARLDDDRIVVMLPRATVDSALQVAGKICRSIEQNRLILPELPGLTVSIGVASYPACAENVYALLDAADEALSLAKKQGRNRAVAARLLPEASPVESSLQHSH